MNGSNDRPVVLLLAQTALEREAYGALLVRCLQPPPIVAGPEPHALAVCVGQPVALVAVADRPTADLVRAVHVAARLRPGVGLVAVSGAEDPGSLATWRRLRPRALVLKAEGWPALRAALDATLQRRTYVARGTRANLDRAAHAAVDLAGLTPRETQLLPLLAEGLTLRAAARRMGVRYKTADAYRTSLMRKLGVHDRVALTRLAIRQGIIEA